MTIRGIEKVPGILDFDQRGIIYASGNDIVITRQKPEKTYLQYLDTLGWNFRNVTFISPNNLNNFKYNSVFYQSDIIDYLKDKKNFYLDCYHSTEEEDNFSEKINTPIFTNPKTALRYGSKSGFRKLCRKLKLNIPFGYEDIESQAEAYTAILDIFQTKKEGALVMKLDEGISGAGNTKISSNFKNIPRQKQLQIIYKALSRVPQNKQSKATIEVWIENIVASPSVQLLITPDGQVRILSMHDQLLEGEEKWYVGCIYPVASLKQSVIDRIKKDALSFARYVAQKGFIGFFGLDSVVDDDDTVWWMEANMRKPATFYPRIIAEKLNNNSLKNAYYIASDFTVSKFKGAKFNKVKNFLAKFLYPIKDEKRGIVLYNVGALQEAGRFDLITIGKNFHDAQLIFMDVKRRLKGLL